MFFLKLLLFFAFVSFNLSFFTVDGKKATYLLKKPQCTRKNQQKIEMIIAKAMAIGPNGRKLPENFDEMRQFCKDTTKMVHQVEVFFKDCYEKSVRDFASIIIYTVKSQMRKFCGKKGSRQIKELLKLGPCANKYVQQNDVCFLEFINKTKQLINIENDRLKFPYLCCYFFDATKCGETILSNIPCMRPHVPMLMDLFRTGSQSIVDFGCGEYNDQTDACERIGPAPKPIPPVKTKYSTIPFVLVDLLNSIKDPSATPGFGI